MPFVEVLTSKKDEQGNTIYPHKFWCGLEIESDDVQGKVGYFGGLQSEEPEEPYVVVVESKIEWPLNNYCQLLSAMYAIMRGMKSRVQFMVH